MAWYDIAGAAMGLRGASAQNKAAQAQAEAMERASMRNAELQRELAAPYLEQAKFALPKLRESIMSLLAPQAGKDDPFIAAQHKTNLSGIDKEADKATASSARLWGSTGNTGRGRGEALRIGQSALDAKNRENLSYGLTQKNVRDNSTSRFIQSLSGLAGLGSTGLTPAMNAASSQMQGEIGAAGIRADATNDIWGDLSAMFGDYVGRRDADKQNALIMKMLEKR